MVEELLKLVSMGGTLVTDEEAQRRKAICRVCPSVGKVDFFGKMLEGCTICGCPLATLTKAKSHILKGGKVECSDEENKKW